MPRQNPYRPFEPDPEQAARAPALSGNEVNGLGEPAFRRPRKVYWADDPADIAHGGLQRFFYERSAGDPRFAEMRARRQAVLDAPLPPLAPVQARRSPKEWTAALADFAGAADFERVGVAEMRPDWAYEGEEIAQSRVVIIAVAHDFDAISTAPRPEAGLEVMRQYMRAAAGAKAVAGWLRAQGWEAEPLTGPLSGRITMIPAAIECGFGELGKHGSIIDPELGSSFRLAAVLTDAPFAPTPRQDHGIDAFCINCRICEDACPPEAIAPEKQLVRGARRWYVDFDRCIPFFNETHGCAICIAICPWSRPGVGLNLAAKLARRAERLAAEEAPL